MLLELPSKIYLFIYIHCSILHIFIFLNGYSFSFFLFFFFSLFLFSLFFFFSPVFFFSFYEQGALRYQESYGDNNSTYLFLNDCFCSLIKLYLYITSKNLTYINTPFHGHTFFMEPFVFFSSFLFFSLFFVYLCFLFLFFSVE